MGASADDAVLAERLQFTVGEGPCLTAHGQDRAVLATADIMAQQWPTFHSELVAKTPYRAILSLPIGNEKFNGNAAMDLYYVDPHPAITVGALDDIQGAADVVGALLVFHSGPSDAVHPVWLNAAAADARSQVWNAMGMVNVSLNLGPADSLATLRSYAYSHDATLDAIAGAIIDGRLSIRALSD